MKKYIVITLCMGVFLIPAFAGATVLYFDDLPYDQAPIPNGYGGLNWNNMYYLDATISPYPNTGYYAGLVSGPNVAFNAGAHIAMVTNSKFDFIGAYLTGAWYDGLNVNVLGCLDGWVIYNQTVVTSATHPTWFQFDFLGIDQLIFSGSGGTLYPPYYYYFGGGNGSHIVMDNFTYNAVPEPSTMLLLGSGLVGLVGYGRRRFKK